jgi:RHS repeat-associated protein
VQVKSPKRSRGFFYRWGGPIGVVAALSVVTGLAQTVTAAPAMATPGPANPAQVGNAGGGSSSASAGGSGLQSQFATTTYADGMRKTVVSLVPSNYRAANGTWAAAGSAIAPTAGGGWSASDRPDPVTFPADASGPVGVHVASSVLSFALVGGAGAGAVAGSTVTYTNALPGVDESYSLLGDGVREWLTLRSSSAPAQYSWTATLPAGMSLKAAGGQLEAVDAAGRVVATVAAPVATDANGATGPASMVVTGGAGGATVTVSVDSSWLSAPGRAFPVTVDPTVYTGTPLGCTLNAAAPTTPSCNTTDMGVGASGGSAQRTVISLANLASALPVDAQIEDVQLYAKVDTATGSAGTISAYPLTTAFSGGASWNNADYGDPWTAAGGDHSATAIGSVSAPSTGGSMNMELSPALIQSIVAGQSPNDGLELAASNETGTNLVDFDPSGTYGNLSFQITWHPITNVGGSYPTYSQQIDDRLGLNVSLANGALVLNAKDFDLAGNGLDATVSRSYNSMDGWDTNVAYAWKLNVGSDANLVINPDSIMAQIGGADYTYLPDGSGGWTTPPGANATLAGPTSGTYTLTFDQGQQVETFTVSPLCDINQPELTSIKDANGDTITYTWDTTRCGDDGEVLLDSLVDTHGHTMTFGASGAGWTNGVTDAASRSVSYSLGGTYSSMLVSSTDAAGKTTYYSYNTNNQLSQITDPDGHIVTIAYDNNGRVTSITQVTNTTALTGPTTTFAYNPATENAPDSGSTTVTDPLARTTTYFYDHNDNTTQVTSPGGASSQTTYNSNLAATTDTNPDGQTATSTYSSSNIVDQTAATQPPSAGGQVPASDTATYNTPSTVTGHQYLPSSVTDAQGNCTYTVYDTAGNVTDTYSGQSSPCDGHTGGTHTATRYQGDPGVTSCGAKTGEVCSTTNGNGNTTSYGYDSLGEQTTVTPPTPLHATTITYDSAGRAATVTDGNGTRTYSYDGDDRVTQILYGGASTCTPSTGNCITYTYDGDGNKTQMVDNTGTTTWAYDNLGRLAKETPSNATTNSCSSPNDAGIVYSYDDAGDLIGQCSGNGTVGYGYDTNGDLLATAAAITQVGLNQTSGTASTLTLNLPAALQANDQIIVAVTVPSTITVTTPTGYTLVGTYGTGSTHEVILRRTAAATDSTVTVALSASTSYAAEAGVYRGVSTSSPIDATSSAAATGTSLTVPGVTATTASDKLLLAAGSTGTYSSGTAFSVPSAMNSDATATATGNVSGSLDSQWLTATGATGNRTVTFPASSALEGVLIALQPATAATAPTAYTYDAAGNRLSTNYPDGVSQNMAYNGASELTNINAINNNTSATLASYSYNWAQGASDQDLRQSVTDNVAHKTTSYSYDAFNRLSQAQDNPEVYIGYGYAANTASAGSSPGYTYDVTPSSNAYIYNTGVTQTSAPTATQSPAGTSLSVGDLINATTTPSPGITAVGTATGAHTTGGSTLSVTPANVGDAFVMSVEVSNSAISVSSITGGGATWTKLTSSSDSAQNVDSELWLGTITTTGSSTITINYSGSVSGIGTELEAQEYTNSTGADTTWSKDTTGNSDNGTSSTTVTFPTLTPAGSSELYVAYARADSVASAGTTPGYTYDITPNNNAYIYNPNVSSSTSPTAAQSPAGRSFAVAALLEARATPSTTISAVGSLASNSGTGTATLSLNPANTGDALVMSIKINSSTIAVSSITGGGATWTKLNSTSDATQNRDVELWLGTVNSTGTSTATVNYTASVTGVSTELSAQEFTHGTGPSTNWNKDTSGTSNNISSTSIAFPSLTPYGSYSGSNNYQYTYDNDGNILTQTKNGTTTTATYNAADQLCWTYSGTSGNACSNAPSGSTTYTFDSLGNGNLTGSSAGVSATYNSKNQTTSITPPGGGALALTDAGQGQSDRTAAGSTSYLNAGPGTLSSSSGGATTSYVLEPLGKVTSVTVSSSTYYYLFDGLGNVVGLVDSSGNRQATYSYDPYGNTTLSGSAAAANPIRYESGIQDSTGLYHFGERYYQPALGQWTQLDPAGMDPAYQYAGDNPINLDDPSGTTDNANGASCDITWWYPPASTCDFRLSNSNVARIQSWLSNGKDAFGFAAAVFGVLGVIKGADGTTLLLAPFYLVVAAWVGFIAANGWLSAYVLGLINSQQRGIFIRVGLSGVQEVRSQ